MLATCALVAATAAAAAPQVSGKSKGAFVQPSLAAAAALDPLGSYDVIVEGDRRGTTQGFVKRALGDIGRFKHTFRSIDGVEAMLTGLQIQKIAKSKDVTAILANDALKPAGSFVPLSERNDQRWAWVSRAPADWTTDALAQTAPTIAVVDSGVDADDAGLGSRFLGQVDMTTSGGNSAGDGFGHGTFVADMAAGGADGYAGVAPNANVLSVDVTNDAGQSTVGDVVNACDWILANKDTYDIRVVNISMQGSARASVFFDPLDQAVEKLWLNGIVVVSAVGNYGVDGQQTEVSYAPGNDPFVISVGASDIADTVDTADDTVAPWSAWGYTADGFAKPDISAPGRYIVAQVPTTGGLAAERPDAVLGPGLMQLSGTSFAAPQVAGAAAALLAAHPDWTPDQVKGALMVSAQATPAAAAGSLGAGELDVAAARAASSPPNPNAGLDSFVGAAADGSPVFDSAAWESAASSDAAWSDAAWSDAAWSDAAWSDAAWSSAAWSDAAWSDAAWSDAAWSDAAVGDPSLPASLMTPDEEAGIEALLGITAP